MHRKKPLSDTQEMYLKTLYEVRGRYDVARVRDLAEGLSVSPGTVSSVLGKLKDMQLVDHERYGIVALTPAGEQVAECVIRRFETLRDTLVEVFGVAPDVAAVDACMMEHAVSPQTVNRMRAMLEAVRGDKLRLARRAAPTDDQDCSDCEAVGVCQAGVTDEPA